MLIAIVATLFDAHAITWIQWIAIGVVIGIADRRHLARDASQMTGHAGDGRAVQRLRRPRQPAGRLGRAATTPDRHRSSLITIVADDPDRRRDLHRQRDRLRQAQRNRSPASPSSSAASSIVNGLLAGGDRRLRRCCSACDPDDAALPGARSSRWPSLSRRDGRDPDRRRRHAGGDLAAEQLLRPRRLRGRLRRSEQHA